MKYEQCTPEDAETLRALERCRELGLAHCYDGRSWQVWPIDGSERGGSEGDTLPEAVAQLLETRQVKVVDGWYLCRHPRFECLVGARWVDGRMEPPPGLEYSAPEMFERVHGPFAKPEGT